MINKKVRQSNIFIESPYAIELTIHEIKLIEYLISECKEEDYKLIGKKQGKEYIYNATHLSKILNTSLSRIVADADKLSNNITQKRIIHKIIDVNNEIEEFHYIPIIISAQYKNGLFEFELNYKVLPFFININKNFTEYQLNYLLSMSSSYAIKLYKLLYQYRNIKKRVFTVLELKKQFGITDKYPSYGDFKKRILMTSINQINELTDLYISFDEIKIGRSVDRLEFYFKMQDKPKKLPPLIIKPEFVIENQQINELIKDIEVELSAKTKELIIEMFKLNGIEYIEASINYAKNNAKSNLDRYLNDTLTNNWAEIEFNKITEKKDKENKEQQLINQKIEEKQQILLKEQEVKLFLEDMWQNLNVEDKANYINQSDKLINKYEKLTLYFDDIDKKLPICLFAIANNTSYDRMLEGYCENILNIL